MLVFGFVCPRILRQHLWALNPLASDPSGKGAQRRSALWGMSEGGDCPLQEPRRRRAKNAARKNRQTLRLIGHDQTGDAHLHQDLRLFDLAVARHQSLPSFTPAYLYRALIRANS